MPRSCGCLSLIAFLSLALSQLAGGGPPTVPGQRGTDPPQTVRTDHYGDPVPDGAVARIGTLRLYTGQQFTALAYLPDGKSLVSADLNSVCLWEAATGKELRQFRAPGGTPYAVAVAPDGKTLATVFGFDTPAIRLWDIPTGRELRQLPGQGSGIAHLTFSPDGKTLAAAKRDHTIHLWDTASWQGTKQLAGHTGFISAIAFLPDGKTLISGSYDKTLRWWDVTTGAETHRLADGLGEPSAVRVSPDGKTLAVAAGRHTLHLLQAATGKGLSRTALNRNSLWALSFSPDGQTLACAGLDMAVRFYAVATGRESGHWAVKNHVTALTFSPDGKVLARAGGGMVWLHDAATGKPAVEVPRLPAFVTAVGFTPGAKTLVVGCWGGPVSFWDPLTGKPEGSVRPAPDGFAEQTEVVHPTRLTADGRKAAAVDAKGVVHVWETATGKTLHRIGDPPGRDVPAGDAQVISPDGRLLAVRHQDKVIRLWDVATGRPLRSVPLPSELTYLQVFSADGRVLVTSSNSATDRTIRVWDTATGEELRRLSWSDGSACFRLALAPDGRCLVTAHETEREPGKALMPRTLRLWDLDRGKELWQVPGPMLVNSVTFSPDGRTVATGDSTTVYLWERASGKERARFTGHRSDVSSLAFSADGRLLTSGSYDYTAVVWDLPGSYRSNQPPVQVLQPDELQRLGADLGSADGSKAYRALWSMAAAARQSVPFLGEHLKPAAPVDGERIARLIADLDSDRFAVREKAATELEEFSELAEPALRKALAGQPAPEVRRRLEQLLEKLFGPISSPDQLRTLRALEVLEYIGTAEARRILESLAKGAPEARLTQEAKASLGRLAS